MIITSYRMLSWVSGPLLHYFLKRRAENGKEDAHRLTERLGISSKPKPSGPLVWVHAASVGESLSMISLIERLSSQRPNLSILITSGTVSSSKILQNRLPERVIHQFVPLDRVKWVRKFLDHWQPDLVLWVESEFWPALLSEIRTRSIPAFLVNARISLRSMRGWRRVPWVIRSLLATFELCMAQTERDADRLTGLGAKNVVCPGNLKFASKPLPANPTELKSLKAIMGKRPRWVAYSTHDGEEETIGRAHQLLKEKYPNLITIIVPRHPNRGNIISTSLSTRGLSVAQRSSGQKICKQTDVLLGDTIGELGLFFRSTNIAFVGGSLVPHGGQNPIEPAQLGCAILHGTHMHNFLAIEGELKAAGASVLVETPQDIAKEVDHLFSNSGLLQERIAAAQTLAHSKSNILDAVFDYIDPALSRIIPAQPVITSQNARA